MSTALKPERPDELGSRVPTPNGSVYVRPQDMDWKPSQFEGIDMKVLYQDVERGEFVWRHPQSKHETKTDEGCVILAIYRKPSIFAKSAGFKAKG